MVYKQILVSAFLLFVIAIPISAQEYHQFLGSNNGHFAKIIVKDPVIIDSKISITIQAVWMDKDLRKVDDLQSRIVLKKSNLIIKPGDMLRCVSFEKQNYISFNNTCDLQFTINPNYGEGEATISFEFNFTESEAESGDPEHYKKFFLQLPSELYMKYAIKTMPFTISKIYTNKALEEKRIALIIGNSDYKYVPKLANPGNDALSINEVLKQLNFTVKKCENLDLNQMKTAIDDFGKDLNNYNVALVYYAGHGIQVNGLNYIVPVDAQIYNESDVDYSCIQVNRILVKMQSARIKTSLVILDACRDNPFTGTWQGNPLSEGLALMDAVSGTLIAYATAPGKTAADGKNLSNGMYTAAFLKHVKTPGITVMEVMQRVRTMVKEESNGQQIPWESTSLEGNFYFNK